MSAISEKWDEFADKIKEQEWFLQLQASYQQLSPEQQTYANWGGVLLALGLIFAATWGLISDANDMKSDYYQKQELLQMVNRASDEIHRLKGQNAGFSQATNQSWKAVFTNLVSSQGLAPESFEILKESPGAAQNAIVETLLDVQIKSVTVRPLVQLLYQVEHGTPPMKLKGLQISTGKDALMNAKLVLSGYLPKPEKEKK